MENSYSLQTLDQPHLNLVKPDIFPTDNTGATANTTASTAFALGARSTRWEPIPQLCYSVSVPLVLRGFSICSGAETPEEDAMVLIVNIHRQHLTGV